MTEQEKLEQDTWILVNRTTMDSIVSYRFRSQSDTINKFHSHGIIPHFVYHILSVLQYNVLINNFNEEYNKAKNEVGEEPDDFVSEIITQMYFNAVGEEKYEWDERAIKYIVYSNEPHTGVECWVEFNNRIFYTRCMVDENKMTMNELKIEDLFVRELDEKEIDELEKEVLNEADKDETYYVYSVLTGEESGEI